MKEVRFELAVWTNINIGYIFGKNRIRYSNGYNISIKNNMRKFFE